ncbi:hypothetical protein ACT3UM_17305 [Halomonas sp. AOP13-D3-9]
MRHLIILLIVIGLAGCATNTFLGRPMAVSVAVIPSVAKYQIADYLRREGYLVSESADGLMVDTKPYKSKPKGIFGWGPVWEEKIVYQITFEEEPVVSPVVKNGIRTYVTSTGTAVNVEALVYERQNANFEWVEAQGEASNQQVIHDFYKNVEKQLRV